MKGQSAVTWLEGFALMVVIAAPGFDWIRAAATIALTISLFDRIGLFSQ